MFNFISTLGNRAIKPLIELWCWLVQSAISWSLLSTFFVTGEYCYTNLYTLAGCTAKNDAVYKKYPMNVVLQSSHICMQDAQQRIKLNTMITFPLSGLDMSRHMPTGRLANIQQQVGKSTTAGGQWLSALRTTPGGRKSPDPSDVYTYDLYAVCNHYGNIFGGHYTGIPRVYIYIET